VGGWRRTTRCPLIANDLPRARRRGSRSAENEKTVRTERHGLEIVTTEMMVFERLRTADKPHFGPAIALVK
jgi:hypothetical protein